MAIELKNLRKVFDGNFVAVNDINCTFEDKTLTVLIGPSGCGKTTTMKMINRLIERSGGDILFDGTSIDEMNRIQLRRSIGYVIQEIGLFPHMTIYENIAVVPRLLKWKEDKIRKRIDELLDLVNLDPKINAPKYPSQLSGGQRQRVGVARGLAADPDILLMDEPFGAIDPINREKLQEGFLEIQQEIHKTIVFVTHDIREAIKLGDRIVILDRGNIVQYDDTMNVIHNPKNQFVEDLLGADRGLKGLELIRIKDNYDTDYFSFNSEEKITVEAAIDQLKEQHRAFGFVVDGQDRLKGYVTRKELRKAEDKNQPIAPHIKETTTIRPEANLMEALSMMFTTSITSVPVINDREKLLGVVRFRELLDKVEEITLQIQEEGEED
jgi:osmoprotectant transport system ATP-binding protein